MMRKLSHRDIKKLARVNRWKIQDLDTRSLLVGMIILTTKLWEENGKQCTHYSADPSLKWHALYRLQSFRIITLSIHDNPVRQGFLSPFYTQGNGSTGPNDFPKSKPKFWALPPIPHCFESALKTMQDTKYMSHQTAV